MKMPKMNKAVLAGATLVMLLVLSCTQTGEPEMLKEFAGTWYARANIEPAGRPWTVATFNTDVKKDPKGHSFKFNLVSVDGYIVTNNDYVVQISPVSSKKCIVSLSHNDKKLFDAVEANYSDENRFSGEKNVASGKETLIQSVSLQKNKEGNLELLFNVTAPKERALRILITLSRKKLGLS